MDRHHVDARTAQRLEHRLQLVLEHYEIAVDHRFFIAANKGGPGVHPHRVAHLVSLQLRGPAESHFVHPITQLTLCANDVFNLLRIKCSLGRV